MLLTLGEATALQPNHKLFVEEILSEYMSKLSILCNRLAIVAIAMFSLFFMPQQLRANDYLEVGSHYSAMSMGNGVMRFTIPVWVYGSYNDYYLWGSDDAQDNNDSYLFWSEHDYAGRGGADVHRFVSVRGERKGRNDGDNSDGEGYIRVHAGGGTVIVNSTYDGVKVTVTESDGWKKLKLKRKSDDDHKRITYFEFDWYPPVSLANQVFYWGVSANIYKKSSGESSYLKWWTKPERYTGGNMPQSPQLLQPYFYAINSEQGEPGRAAMQYAVYQEPISYTTSFNTQAVTTTERSGTLFVSTADTVRTEFKASFNVYVNKEAQQTAVLQTNTVNIPAYHKPYDLKAVEVLDDKQSVTGQVNLSWNIHTPKEEDLVPSDVFEVQRAVTSDFANAQTIAIVPYSPDSTTYHLTDDPSAVLRDSAVVKQGEKVQYSANDLMVTDANGDKLAIVNATLYADKVLAAGQPLYYRMRRASSAVWNWSQPYALSTSLMKEGYLAPLAPTQDNYVKDADFDTNRKVHFYLKLDNRQVTQQIPPKEECRLEYTVQSTASGSPLTSEQVAVLKTRLTDELYTKLRERLTPLSNARCNWDKNANLVLIRTIVETGETFEFFVPHDSIVRQGDGSWRAHFTDVADRMCVHYKYAVRIDQSGSVLKLSNADDLKAIQLKGDDLFGSQTARFASFTATQGTDRQGVHLIWIPTAGGVDGYTLSRRKKDTSNEWEQLPIVAGRTDFRDTNTEPDEQWEYRATVGYTCGVTTSADTAYATGWRSPFGSIAGRIHFEDGTGCTGIEVAIESDGQKLATVTTDESGNYKFDSLRYGTGTTYTLTPTSQTAQFRYNNTSAATATITLSKERCEVTNIDFDNISAVRFSGRVLYKNSTIPVRDAQIWLNGRPARNAVSYVLTDNVGNFDLHVPQNAPFTLQIRKDGHRFDNDGFIRIDGSDTLTLTKALDGVRVYDLTKVRLAGRIIGGATQAALAEGFGLSKNNLGDDLKIVLELEGDNTSFIVHLTDDPNKDSLHYHIPHLTYAAATHQPVDTVGATAVEYQHKRIIIAPDAKTGEYAADLFPVKYKIVQATAKGYASLFSDGSAAQTIDLTAAPVHADTLRRDTVYALRNAAYSLTYRSPINISCLQMRYGMVQNFYGEQTMSRQNIAGEQITVPLVEQTAEGDIKYLFGNPVFSSDKYDFRITVHEDYYYNNVPTGKHEEVRIRGGEVKVYNGLNALETPDIQTYVLNQNGETDITLDVNNISIGQPDDPGLRRLDISVAVENDYIEKQAFKAYITGNRAKGRNFITSTHAITHLLDVLRDPPGSKSYAYIEAGTTYKYNYTYDFTIQFGLDVSIFAGTATNVNIGTYAGAGSGVYSGHVLNLSSMKGFSLPIKSSYYYKHQASYTFTTTDRIETGSDPYYVGNKGDVYIGTTQNVYFGLTDAVKPIDSLTYAFLSPRETNSTMKVLGVNRGKDGKLYYLVIGTETEAGTYLNSSFYYTHDHIVSTLIPQLKMSRDALLMTGDSAAVKAAADKTHKVMYWSRVPATDAMFGTKGTYSQILPDKYNEQMVYPDEVDAYNRQITDWIDILVANEKEKISATYGTNVERVGTWSVSGGTTASHSEAYEFANTYTKRIDYPGGSLNLNVGFGNAVGQLFGQNISSLVTDKLNGRNDQDNNARPLNVESLVPDASLKFSLTPILDVNFDRDPNRSVTQTKKTGFVLHPDDKGYIDVSVYRIVDDKSAFNSASQQTRTDITAGHDYDGKSYRYGSFVYYLNGGATRCPWEKADSTQFYTPRMPLSAGSLKIDNQKIEIDSHEHSNVPADQPAIFNLRLTNESHASVGGVQRPITFYLKQQEQSNPHGAKIMVDGMPLSGDGRAITLHGSEIINKTMEVFAGEGYDFENLTLEFVSECDVYNKAYCTFSVHYMPVSCQVNIAAPHDNWTMNTLSPRDSTGYYLPVTINGFNVNYNGFDHIELQYKLTTESDDRWVNMCSFYASDSLYAAASGNKAMITDGKISNIRFYGYRDPVEQQYDLRAVSFCRHGSGMISRSSVIRTGTKDTRPPRVFGTPQPADAILSVGENLMLRFNEAIAGNWLDEDNNFQVLGSTNSIGMNAETSVQFDGSDNSYAASQAERNLNNKSFSIDMLINPAQSNQKAVFFIHKNSYDGWVFGLTDDNRLYVTANGTTVYSATLKNAITALTRVVCAYDHKEHRVHFYAGTSDVTDAQHNTIEYSGSGILTFGRGFSGRMMEVRVWTKALSPAEVAETNLKRLTGYEHKLAAYYPMNEGRGNTLHDHANGATLYMKGAGWNVQEGMSMRFTGDEQLILNSDVLSRSAMQDATIMLWFKTAEAKGTLFSAGRKDAKHGFAIEFDADGLKLKCDSSEWIIGSYADNEWQHLVLSVNRTFNNASVYINGNIQSSFAASELGAISGVMYLGGNGFTGHVDDLIFYEQALPKDIIARSDNVEPHGNEMGLIAHLRFSERKQNANGIYELVFSPNDQRIITDSEGKVINKIIPLITGMLGQSGSEALQAMADKTDHAPLRVQEELTKLKFDWAYNNDQLLINLNMLDGEINKRMVYITVRGVEDLSGNPMPSPVTWCAQVDKNSIKWSEPAIDLQSELADADLQTEEITYRTSIINTSGIFHHYKIEALPDWLSATPAVGTLEAQEYKTITLKFKQGLPAGVYSEMIYLTDENDLREPIKVEYRVNAQCPWQDVDKSRFTMSSSLRGKVTISDPKNSNRLINATGQDVVAAFCNGLLIGKAAITADSESPTSAISNLYLTLFGDRELEGLPVTFKLWRAATAKVYNLAATPAISFVPSKIYGYTPDAPVQLVTIDSQTQTVKLNDGWNWMSLYLLPQPSADLNAMLNASPGFSAGHIIKSPAEQSFAEFTVNPLRGKWVGPLRQMDYHYTYMMYVDYPVEINIVGSSIPDSARYVTLHQGWNAIAFLLDEPMSIREALADYYENATQGDLIKTKESVAVFSEDGKWEGSLQTLTPGQGYLMHRQEKTTVKMHYYPATTTVAAKAQVRAFSNPQAAANMTMIAKLSDTRMINDKMVNVYVGDELAGVAEPTEVNGEQLYFLTIQSDKVGAPLLFITGDGQRLAIQANVQMDNGQMANTQIVNAPDAHHGSLKAPVILTPLTEDADITKVLKDDRVIIIRNGQQYDMLGSKLY